MLAIKGFSNASNGFRLQSTKCSQKISKRTFFPNQMVNGNSNLDGIKVATVFGGSGFLGRYVTENLIETGFVVLAPFRTEAKCVDHLKVMGEVGQVAPIRFTLNDSESIDKCVEHSDLVVNMIGRSWETRNFNYDQVHIDGARAIAEASKKAGVERFIHFSAVGADENSNSPFLRSKAKGEKAVREVLPNSIILRLAPVYGWEDKILNKWGRLCSQNKAFRSLVPLDAEFQPIHCVDVADAVSAVVKSPQVLGKTFELAGPQKYTLEQFINEVILPVTETRPSISVVPYQYAKKIAELREYLRNPPFLLSEVENFQQSLVPSGSYPGLKELGVTPTTIDEMSRAVLRPYRPRR